MLASKDIINMDKDGMSAACPIQIFFHSLNRFILARTSGHNLQCAITCYPSLHALMTLLAKPAGGLSSYQVSPN